MRVCRDTCLMNGKGMTMPEFEHYKATGKPDQVNPSDANTIDMSGLAQHPAGAHAGGAGGGGGAGGAGGHGHAHGGHNHSSHGGHHGVKVPAEVNATEHGMHVGLRHWPVAPGRELREHLMMRMRGMDVVYIKDRFRVPDINRMVDENVYKRLSDMLTFCPAMFAAHMYFYQTGPNAGPGPLRRLLGE